MGRDWPAPLSAPGLALGMVGAFSLYPTIFCLRPAGNPSLNSYPLDPRCSYWIPIAALDLFHREYSPARFLAVRSRVGAQFAGDLVKRRADAYQPGDHPAPVSRCSVWSLAGRPASGCGQGYRPTGSRYPFVVSFRSFFPARLGHI